MMSAYAPLTIASAQGNYTVEQFEAIDALVDCIATIPNAFIVADERIVSLYGAAFARLDRIPLHTMPATESEKTLIGVEKGLLALQASGGSKHTTVVGIGGGIIQDVSTLVAHLWYRGVDFVFVPTTLLAMADSCIGAKTAVNLGSFKNQVGTFQSPKRVLMCERFVDTLDDDAIRSGYGEIVKLAIVESADAFAEVRADLERDGFRGPALTKHVRMSLETKARVIEIDEYEVNLRKTLNFGHTFGHALESVVDNDVPHGLAVAWGVDVASYVSAKLGKFDPEQYAYVHAFLKQTFARGVDRSYDAPSLIAAMKRDKKAAAGSVSLILPHAIGQLEIVPTAIGKELEALIAGYLRTDDIFTHR